MYIYIYVFVFTYYSLVAQICLNHYPRVRNGHNFTDDMFTCIFVNEKFCILIKISLKFVPKGSIDNKWALAQVMTWCRTGNCLNQCWPSLMTHIYGTRRWVKWVIIRSWWLSNKQVQWHNLNPWRLIPICTLKNTIQGRLSPCTCSFNYKEFQNAPRRPGRGVQCSAIITWFP